MMNNYDYRTVNQPLKKPFLSAFIKQHWPWILGLLTVPSLIYLLKPKPNRSEPLDEPLETVNQAVDQPLNPTASEPLDDAESEQENIRRVMSMLGKRSGKARRNKE